MIDEVYGLMWQHLGQQSLAGIPCDENALVFPSSCGTHRYPSVLIKPLERCCATAGVAKRLTAHSLRHTANNLIRQVGGDVAAQQMMGHVDGKMTDRYSQVSADEQRRHITRALGFGVKLGEGAGGSAAGLGVAA
jgi:integrase